MHGNASWQPTPHVVFSPLDDGVAVLDAKKNIYYSLDGVGPFLWRRLVEGQNFARLCQAVVDNFEIDEAVARADIAEWIASMTAMGLIGMNDG